MKALENKYLTEKVFGFDIEHLSTQARQAIFNLEKAIEKNSPNLSKVAASTLHIIYNEGYEQGEKSK